MVTLLIIERVGFDTRFNSKEYVLYHSWGSIKIQAYNLFDTNGNYLNIRIVSSLEYAKGEKSDSVTLKDLCMTPDTLVFQTIMILINY